MALSAFPASRALVIAALLAHALAGTAGAQVTPPNDGRTVTPRDTANPSRYQTLFTRRDALLAAGFVGLTFAMFPVDRHFAEELQRPELRDNRYFDRSATGVAWIATPGSTFIGAGLYVAGKVTKNKDLADLGWHGMEAIVLSSVVTTTLKGTLGRARPYLADEDYDQDFKFWRGWSSNDFKSFPSGHTTTAFAAAAAVTSEARRVWPGSTWFVAPAMYGGATLVGLSRMYQNNHWASDVVLGAAIGTFSGLKVVRYSHAHPDNKLDRFILGATILPDPRGGGVLAFSFPAP